MTPPKLDHYQRSLGEVVVKMPARRRPRLVGETAILWFTVIGLVAFALALAWVAK